MILNHSAGRLVEVLEAPIAKNYIIRAPNAREWKAYFDSKANYEQSHDLDKEKMADFFQTYYQLHYGTQEAVSDEDAVKKSFEYDFSRLYKLHLSAVLVYAAEIVELEGIKEWIAENKNYNSQSLSSEIVEYLLSFDFLLTYRPDPDIRVSLENNDKAINMTLSFCDFIDFNARICTAFTTAEFDEWAFCTLQDFNNPHLNGYLKTYREKRCDQGIFFIDAVKCTWKLRTGNQWQSNHNSQTYSKNEKQVFSHQRLLIMAVTLDNKIPFGLQSQLTNLRLYKRRMTNAKVVVSLKKISDYRSYGQKRFYNQRVRLLKKQRFV